MRNTILRSAAIFSFVILAGLAIAYVGSSKADALGLSAPRRARYSPLKPFPPANRS